MVKRAPKPGRLREKTRKTRNMELARAKLQKHLLEAHARLENLKVAKANQAIDALVAEALVPFYLTRISRILPQMPQKALDELLWDLTLRGQGYLSSTQYFSDPVLRLAQISAKVDTARGLHSRITRLLESENQLPQELSSFDALHEDLIKTFAQDR